MTTPAMTTYQTLGNAAVLAFHAGRHREAANKYLEAFQYSSRSDDDDIKYEPNRYQILEGYTSILRERYFPISSSDLDALKDIATNKQELKVFRVEAAFTVGLLSWDSHQREDSAEWYRECIAMAQRMKPQDRDREFIATQLSADKKSVIGLGMVKCGILADNAAEKARSNLDILTRSDAKPLSYGHPKPTTKQYRSDGSVIENEVRSTFFVASSIAEMDLTTEQVNFLLSVGGERCDGCGKDRTELGMSNLDACSRCKRAYYCSKECQSRQWRMGHKEYCRKPGEVKGGDYLRLNGIESRTEWNGMVVRAIQPDPNHLSTTDHCRWMVTSPAQQNRPVSIAITKLEQLRPLK